MLFFRRVHTELVKCGSDVEYLAKVHCLRQAYTRLFGQPSAATWIADVGRQLISDLIIFADRVSRGSEERERERAKFNFTAKFSLRAWLIVLMVCLQDPKDYLNHYERMLEFLTEESSLSIMEEELGNRGVRCINFYDVVIDFILLDAFDEVEKPPSSIKAILQNRWISASFRETVSELYTYGMVNVRQKKLLNLN